MKKYIMIGSMGIAGALCRYGVSLLFPSGFPWSTLIVNMLGCLLLPVIFIVLRELGTFSDRLVTAMGTGFIGAFTTLSSFTVEIIKLLSSGKTGTAATYLLLSTAGGLTIAYLSVLFSTKAIRKIMKKKEV